MTADFTALCRWSLYLLKCQVIALETSRSLPSTSLACTYDDFLLRLACRCEKPKGRLRIHLTPLRRQLRVKHR